MSALTNPTPLPVPPPPQRVSPVAPPEPPKKGFPWKGLLTLVLIGAGAFVAYQRWLSPQAQKPAAPVIVYRTAPVTKGAFTRTLRIGGVTAARQYTHVTAPRPRGPEARGSMELLTLAKDGTWVKKGEELAQIDAGYLVDHIDDIKATIFQSEIDIAKRQAEQAMEMENLQQTLRVAKSTFDKAKLDAQATEVRTEIEQELLKLAVDEADAKFKQSGLDVPQKKIGDAAEVKILGITTERHRRHIGRHQSDMKAYTIFSPMEGLLVVQTTFRAGEMYKIQQGDQLGSGQALLRVVNPKSMQVEANANQAEAADVRIGQKATIGLDAFPGLTFSGKVYSMGALAVGGWRQNFYIRNVPMKLAIESADPRLIPDLSAYADIVVEEKPNATLVPLGAVEYDGDKTFVRVKEGEGFNRKEVKLGSSNNLYAVVESGVAPGDQLRID